MPSKSLPSSGSSRLSSFPSSWLARCTFHPLHTPVVTSGSGELWHLSRPPIASASLCSTIRNCVFCGSNTTSDSPLDPDYQFDNWILCLEKLSNQFDISFYCWLGLSPLSPKTNKQNKTNIYLVIIIIIIIRHRIPFRLAPGVSISLFIRWLQSFHLYASLIIQEIIIIFFLFLLLCFKKLNTTLHSLSRQPRLVRIFPTPTTMLYQHRHSTSQMPHNVTMKQPYARIISFESQNRISSSQNLDCVSQDGFAQVVWMGSSSLAIGRSGPGIIRAPSRGAGRGLVDIDNIKIMTVLFSPWDYHVIVSPMFV